MKRVHRRWHRRIGWVLVPAILVALALAAFMRMTPTNNAVLPPTLNAASAAQESR